MYDKENTPLKLKKLIDTTKNEYRIASKSYIPLYIGYNEANMMQKEKLFTKVGDTINNLFGNDVMIAGITKKTYTSLDMMHFVPKSFSVNK